MSQIKIEFNKTYANRKNAENAAINRLGPALVDQIRWLIVPIEVGASLRYGILLIGEKAIQHGLHFDFNVVG